METNKEVTAYIERALNPQKEILIQLRKLISESVTDVKEEYKWSQPVYSVKKDFCYLKAAKNHVNLGFMNSGVLDDPDHLLEGTGKSMRHIKLKSVDDINASLFIKWLVSASH